MTISTQRFIWWASAVILSVVIALIIGSETNRDNLINGCKRNGDFKATEARAWEEAARARTREGELGTAATYTATARQIRLTIPMPSDWTEEKDGRRGEDLNVVDEGCHEAFPSVLPGILD